jgi:hypothetical protein
VRERVRGFFGRFCFGEGEEGEISDCVFGCLHLWGLVCLCILVLLFCAVRFFCVPHVCFSFLLSVVFGFFFILFFGGLVRCWLFRGSTI